MILLALAFAAVSKAAQFCTSDNAVCLNTEVSNDNMVFTISYTAQGWAAVAFGKSMDDADVMMVYQKNGNFTVEDRYATSQVLPALSTYQVSKLVPENTNTTGGVKYVQFTRPLKFSDSQHRILDKGISPMLYAYSDVPVTDQPQTHSDKGDFRINLFSDDNVVGSASKKNFYVYHGILMFIAWNIFSPVGIFIARYLKATMGVWWFRSHLWLLLGSIVFTVVAFALAVVATEEDHFDGPHQIIGLVVFILAVLQGFFGQVINMLFDPRRKAVPWYDKAHWWLGRLLVLLAMANVIYGIYTYGETGGDENKAQIFFYVTIGLTGFTGLVFVFGQFQIGQTHHHQEPPEPILFDSYKENAYNFDSFGMNNSLKSMRANETGTYRYHSIKK